MGKAKYLHSQVHTSNFLPSWQTDLQFGSNFIPNTWSNTNLKITMIIKWKLKIFKSIARHQNSVIFGQLHITRMTEVHFFVSSSSLITHCINLPWKKIRSPFKHWEFLLPCRLSHCQINASANYALGCWKKVRQPHVGQIETEPSEAVSTGTAPLLPAGICWFLPARSLAYRLDNIH